MGGGEWEKLSRETGSSPFPHLPPQPPKPAPYPYLMPRDVGFGWAPLPPIFGCYLSLCCYNKLLKSGSLKQQKFFLTANLGQSLPHSSRNSYL